MYLLNTKKATFMKQTVQVSLYHIIRYTINLFKRAEFTLRFELVFYSGINANTTLNCVSFLSWYILQLSKGRD